MRSRSGIETFGLSKYFLFGQMRSDVPVSRGRSSSIFFSFSVTTPFSKTMRCSAAFALHLDFEPLGKRVRHRHADAVQAAGELVRGVGFGLRELGAGVQLGEDELHGRDLLFRDAGRPECRGRCPRP